MTRAEKITFAKKLVNSYQQQINECVARGVFLADEYTWQEYLAENTGVDVDTLAQIDTLSDADLERIVDAYC